ncbi:single-stranded DNA-binding protein [Arthrobacter sp. TMN-49]
MANTVTIKGFATTGIELRTTPTGLVVGDFRMGSNERRLDPITNVWTDGPTNWFRVTVFRALAQNAASSIHKGDRIIVVGKLKISTFLHKDGTPGTNVDIDAESIGPDLKYGTAHYVRVASAHPAGQDYSRNDAESSNVVPLHSGSGGVGGQPHDDYSDRDDADGLNQDGTNQDGENQGMDPEDAENQAATGVDQDGPDDGEFVNKATGELFTKDVPF